MARAKELLEVEKNNTYGIEIEFGTHDNQMLSFTHIEVCKIWMENDTNKRNEGDAWKIETDADYTLELVSPILQFPDQKKARAFRSQVEEFFRIELKTGALLGDLLDKLCDQYINKKFSKTTNGFWEYGASAGIPVAVDRKNIVYISEKELVKELDWHNWDEDTDLERVIAAKSFLDKESELKLTKFESITVTRSRKHGGLPSSQTNLPLNLGSYVLYSNWFKRQQAWDRLKGQPDRLKEESEGMVEKILGRYPGIQSDDIWVAKHNHEEYEDSLLDEKIPIGHRYWLWLETYETCAYLLVKHDGKAEAKNDPYFSELGDIIREMDLCNLDQVITDFRELSLVLQMGDYRNCAYLTLQKIVTGALSELSECAQQEAQKLVMSRKGDIVMQDIMPSFPESEFMHFHYALKDLTSLWFKAPLLDVFYAEIESKSEFRSSVEKISEWDPKVVASLVEKALWVHLQFLGRYYGLRAACNRGFEYSWEDFKQYNMPSLGSLARKVELCFEALKKDLEEFLNNGDRKYVARIRDIPESESLRFLERKYKSGLVVACWEGRWDTMKPVIRAGRRPKYLVEHRNN